MFYCFFSESVFQQKYVIPYWNLAFGVKFTFKTFSKVIMTQQSGFLCNTEHDMEVNHSWCIVVTPPCWLRLNDSWRLQTRASLLVCVWVGVCQHYLYQCSGHLLCLIVGLSSSVLSVLYLYRKYKKERQTGEGRERMNV